MLKFVVAPLVILTVLLGWIGVQQLYRRFALRHPEYGPYRDDDTGCGSGCLCGSNKACGKQRSK